MATRTQEEVQEYVEWQCQNNCKVINSKSEQTFTDLGFEVTVWNVKTDSDGSWWVVEGDGLPMNLYPQDKAYYFSADEAYSFHIGLMSRLKNDKANIPENIVNSIVRGVEIAPDVRRKLEYASQVLIDAVETEDIQTVGMVCRETLILLGNNIYNPGMAGDEEQPKNSDFKSKVKLAIEEFLIGSDNAELRDHMRKTAYAAWDFASKLTHSTTRSIYEAAICVTLCTAVVSVFENLHVKNLDPTSTMMCSTCGSRQLIIIEADENSANTERKIIIECEKCGGSEETLLVLP